MGLYDSKAVGAGFKFGFVWKQFKYPVLGISVLIIAFALLFLVVLPALQPKPLDAFLQPNPLDLTKGQNSFLTVAVNNTTGATAKNVVVEVSTEASDAITIYPASKAIETLGKGEMRKLEDAFVISPNPEKKAVSGTYIITVKTKVNELSVEKQVALELKAV
jgi:uncharacterized protein (TIGR02588 family)